MPPAGERAGLDLERLMPLVYDELRAVAEHYFRRQPPGFTLRPTEIVHEAFLYLLNHGQIDCTSTQHFRAIAIKKIWQVVVDHLKHRHAQKRGGLPRSVINAPPTAEPTTSGAAPPPKPWRRVQLDAVSVAWHDQDVDLLDLADALAELSNESRRLNDVVMLHWFGGLTYAEVAEQLGVSSSTVEKDFRYALAWLNRRLEGTHKDGN